MLYRNIYRFIRTKPDEILDKIRFGQGKDSIVDAINGCPPDMIVQQNLTFSGPHELTKFLNTFKDFCEIIGK